MRDDDHEDSDDLEPLPDWDAVTLQMEAEALVSRPAIRSALRDGFPTTRFSLRVQGGKFGAPYLVVRWSEGPREHAVAECLAPFNNNVLRLEAPITLQRTVTRPLWGPGSEQTFELCPDGRWSMESHVSLEAAIARAQVLLASRMDVKQFDIIRLPWPGSKTQTLVGTVSRDRGFREA
jgi:hypothetical protein